MRKKEERKNNKSLISLYFSFLFDKKTLIAILITLILLSISLIFIFKVDKDEYYLENYLNYHQSYFNLSLLIIGILNGILISFFVINLSIYSTNFDCLFISYIKREKISIIKIITILIALFLLLTIEFIIIVFIGLLKYNHFKISKDFIITFYYNYLAMIFEVIASIALTEIFHIIFTPFLVLFIFLIIRILMNNFNNFKDLFINYFPYLTYNSKNNIFEFGNPIIALIIIFSLIIVYVELYSIKDMK